MSDRQAGEGSGEGTSLDALKTALIRAIDAGVKTRWEPAECDLRVLATGRDAARRRNVGSLADSEEVPPNATTPQRPVQHQSGAPGWNRTSDTRFRKPVLYPLSYEGIVPICRDFTSATAGPEYQSC